MVDPVVAQIIERLRREKRARERLVVQRSDRRRYSEPAPLIKGRARIRTIDARCRQDVLRLHPDWHYDEQRQLMLDRGTESDTDWTPNTVCDFARTYLTSNAALSAPDIFIHEGTMPGNVRGHALQFIYTSQVPNQVRNPDSTVLDEAALLQTYTVQFPAPSVARNINIAGLTQSTSADTASNSITLIHAYSLLSTTVVQGTAQVADVQYRLTWSLDG